MIKFVLIFPKDGFNLIDVQMIPTDPSRPRWTVEVLLPNSSPVCPDTEVETKIIILNVPLNNHQTGIVAHDPSTQEAETGGSL